jgi:hypothetical protein
MYVMFAKTFACAKRQINTFTFSSALQKTQLNYLDCCEGCHDGRRPESVSDEREVRQVALDGRIQDLRGPGVAQRRPVLVQEVHQLLDNHPGKGGPLNYFKFMNSF